MHKKQRCPSWATLDHADATRGAKKSQIYSANGALLNGVNSLLLVLYFVDPALTFRTVEICWFRESAFLQLLSLLTAIGTLFLHF